MIEIAVEVYTYSTPFYIPIPNPLSSILVYVFSKGRLNRCRWCPRHPYPPQHNLNYIWSDEGVERVYEAPDRGADQQNEPRMLRADA